MKYLEEAKYFRPVPCQSQSRFPSTASGGVLMLYLQIFTGRCNNMGEFISTPVD